MLGRLGIIVCESLVERLFTAYLTSSSASPPNAEPCSPSTPCPPCESLVVTVTVIWMVKMAWDREDTSFMAVAAVALERPTRNFNKHYTSGVSGYCRVESALGVSLYSSSNGRGACFFLEKVYVLMRARRFSLFQLLVHQPISSKWWIPWLCMCITVQ